jgi:indolepyruvate ferredoxin oxidoreductase beta subunit
MHAGRTGKKGSACRIVIAGTGGQGVLTAAKLLCDAFVARGHEVVSGQLHGMAQRGGAVQSSVIIDGGISPVIANGRADFVVGFEPVETVRAANYLSPSTAVYMNLAPVVPFVMAQRTVLKQNDANYPKVSGLVETLSAATDHLFTLDATQCAIEAGAAKALNMVMLGCLFASDELPCSADEFLEIIISRVPAKLKEVNIRAFRSGVEAAKAWSVGSGSA